MSYSHRGFEGWGLPASAVLLVAVATSGCLKKSELFCDEDTPCTDPERPFCDLNGDFPASEGIGKTCIPDPNAGVDGGSVDGGLADGGLSCSESFITFSSSGSVFVVDDSPGATPQDISVTIADDSNFPIADPRGRFVAFVSIAPTADNTLQLYDRDTGLLTPLTTSPNGLTPASFTADGLAILYVELDGPTRRIWRKALTPGPSAMLTETSLVIGGVSAAPSGVIAYARGGDVYFMDDDGSDEREFQVNATDPSFAPDGLNLVMTTSDDEVVRSPASSSVLVNVSMSAAEDDSGVLSSTDRVAFVSERDGERQIYWTEGASLHRHASAERDFGPVWSPQGDRVLFFRSFDLTMAELVVTDLDDNEVVVDTGGMRPQFYDWSGCRRD